MTASTREKSSDSSSYSILTSQDPLSFTVGQQLTVTW